MLVVHVHIHVKAEVLGDFIDATRENARYSLDEPGVVRFDLAQSRDDPQRFVLVEVYRDEDAPGHHKETDHYKKWRDTVADMMAEPRWSEKYTALYPEEERWETFDAL